MKIKINVRRLEGKNDNLKSIDSCKSNSNLIRIAIVDSGLDMRHPYFAGLSINTKSFTKSIYGMDDVLGHGTHHLGVIVNLAKSEINSLYFIIAKVVDDYGLASWKQVDAAIHWSLSQKANLISIGVGASESTDEFYETIRCASRKALVVAPVGNDFVDGVRRILYPARYPEVLGVDGYETETEHTKFVSFCNGCDILAPNRAYGAIPGGRFEQREGTSVASAIVVGFSVRLIAEFPHIVNGIREGKGKKSIMEYLNQNLVKEVIAMDSS